MDRRRRERSRAALVGAVAVSAVGLLVLALRASAPKSRALGVVERVGATLRVPRASAPPKLDGEVDDWRGAHAQTGMFKSVDGQNAPDSEARLVWGDGKLFLLLYAADQDIRASVKTHDAPLWPEDAFKLSFGQPGEAAAHVIYVSPIGTITDEAVVADRLDSSWESHAEVAHDVDGTLNDSHDEDEEWVVEMALPLSSLGLRGEPGERIGFSVRRCDVPKGAGRRCTAWGEPDGMLVLE